MKKEIIRTEDAVGKILAHDITRIVKGEFKGSLFKKGHIIAPEDVDRLLDVSQATANRILKHMVAEGLIYQDGNGRKTKYRRK